MKLKLRKGDQVKVLLGKDRGKTGKIEKVFPRTGKVLVLGVNVAKKHVKPRGEGKPGGIVDVTKPIAVSKIAFFCPKCSQVTRLGFKIGKDTKKLRICRKCGQAV